jgi:hypothetical protein
MRVPRVVAGTLPVGHSRIGDHGKTQAGTGLNMRYGLAGTRPVLPAREPLRSNLGRTALYTIRSLCHR